ncbi:hypothetical protein M758_5G200200 [Ceratodon purpureus]|uniref:Uncharacterized protein n=1 Tax=Ceratodon purpureus TaxID=3225 RepID=A0A8T0I602_CERPU|nr:hypothetical protein KC19_5G206800 [Ceratodon purpureus]KAG0617574.1 hypothetical protein M758_5G200200 [Ceratodon purpureus]
MKPRLYRRHSIILFTLLLGPTVYTSMAKSAKTPTEHSASAYTVGIDLSTLNEAAAL